MLDLLNSARSLLPGLARFRWSALAAAVATGIAGTALVLAMPARYEATARVYVDTQSILKPLMQGLAVQPNLDTQVVMMAKTLISRPNLEKVISMADLDHKATTPREREELIRELNKDLQFRAAGGQNLYSITYRAETPAQATKVVQSLLSMFIESNLGDKRRDADQAIRFIDDQLRNYERKLIEAEAALKDFKVRNLDVMPNLAQDAVARNADLQRELDSARLELRQLDNSREAIRRQLSEEKPSFVSSDGGPDTAAIPRPPSEIELRLDASRKRLDELVTRYTEQHPDVINARRVVAELEQQRDAARRGEVPAGTRMLAPTVIPNKVYQDLKVALADVEAKLAAARARVAEAERRYAQSRALAQAIPKVEAEYVQLTREYETTKKSHEQLLSRRESAQISGSMDASGVGEMRIVDPPRATSTPVSPNRPLLLLLVLAASAAAGVGVAFLRDQSNPVFFDLRSLRAATSGTVLGSVTMVLGPEARSAERNATLRFASSAVLYGVIFLAGVSYAAYLQYLR